MPKSCKECKYYRLDAGYTFCTILNKYKDGKDCPLKSTDEMKNELLNCSFSVVNPSNTYEYVNVVNLANIETVIDKYCDKEN